MGRFLVVALVVGCVSPQLDDLAISSVEPSTGVNTKDTPVDITGAFPLDIRSDLDEGTTIVGDFHATIDNIGLDQAVRIDATTIHATVPANLALGPHDISVTLGTRTAVLPGGYVVTEDTGPTPPPPPFCNPGDLDLRACFTFDGELLDGSSYKNDLATTSTAPVFVADRNGGQALVTATGTYSTAATTSLDVTSFTLKMYINPESLPASGTRMGLFDASGHYRMFLEAGGAIRCAVTPGTVIQLVTPAGAVIPNVWQRVACTYDGTTMTIYVDGTAIATATVAGTIPTAFAGFVVGHDSPSGSNFDGAIDELQLWGSLVAP